MMGSRMIVSAMLLMLVIDGDGVNADDGFGVIVNGVGDGVSIGVGDGVGVGVGTNEGAHNGYLDSILRGAKLGTLIGVILGPLRDANLVGVEDAIDGNPLGSNNGTELGLSLDIS